VLDSSRTLLERTGQAIEASERRCDAAQQRMLFTDLHIITNREAISRSQDQIARLASCRRLGLSATQFRKNRRRLDRLIIPNERTISPTTSESSVLRILSARRAT